MLAAAPAVMIAYVHFGSEGDICSAKRHVRFTPESGHQKAMQPIGCAILSTVAVRP